MNTKNIKLRNLKDCKNDYLLLTKWYQNKNVYEWFEQRKLTYKEIENKYRKKLKDNKQSVYIINYNNIDIGLVQIYKYNNDINLYNLKEYKNIYEYDIFIGNIKYINKGIGKNLINAINEFIYKNYKADSIILRPFKRNIRAIKCYQKCNYKIIHEYIDTDTLGNKEDVVVLLHTIDKWKFGVNNEYLTKLVLTGKKRATTSLYKLDNIPNIGDLSILTDSNNNYLCLIETKKIIITRFKNITWNLAKLEGESKSLTEWRNTHKDYYSSIDKKFNENYKVIFEIFKVIK